MRQPFQQRTFRLVGAQQVAGLIGNLPIDEVHPLGSTAFSPLEMGRFHEFMRQHGGR